MTYAKQTITSGIAIVRFEGSPTPEVFNAPFTLVYKDGAVVSIGSGEHTHAPYESSVDEQAQKRISENERKAWLYDRDVPPRFFMELRFDPSVGQYRGGIESLWIVDEAAHIMASTYRAVLTSEEAPQWRLSSASVMDISTDSRLWYRRFHELTDDSQRKKDEAHDAMMKRGEQAAKDRVTKETERPERDLRDFEAYRQAQGVSISRALLIFALITGCAIVTFLLMQ